MNAPLREQGTVAREPAFMQAQNAARQDAGVAPLSTRVFRRYPQPRTAAAVRLFCFPFAGAGAGAYAGWAAHLPAWIEPVGITYPGREARFGEPLLRSLDELVDGLLASLLGAGDRPYAFFGHSMGAYVAFEVARRLTERTAGPEALFLSGASAPRSSVQEPLHTLPPQAFFREVIRLNGIPDEIKAEPALLQLLLPILRADFIACEQHRWRDGPPCSVPLHVFSGDADIRACPERVERWRDSAGGAFQHTRYPGDHFFLRPHAASLAAVIARDLQDLAAEAMND